MNNAFFAILICIASLHGCTRAKTKNSAETALQERIERLQKIACETVTEKTRIYYSYDEGYAENLRFVYFSDNTTRVFYRNQKNIWVELNYNKSDKTISFRDNPNNSWNLQDYWEDASTIRIYSESRDLLQEFRIMGAGSKRSKSK